MSLPPHPVWWALVAACLIWYSTITVMIAVRGMKDVQTLIARLRASSGPAGPGGESKNDDS